MQLSSHLSPKPAAKKKMQLSPHLSPKPAVQRAVSLTGGSNHNSANLDGSFCPSFQNILCSSERKGGGSLDGCDDNNLDRSSRHKRQQQKQQQKEAIGEEKIRDNHDGNDGQQHQLIQSMSSRSGDGSISSTNTGLLATLPISDCFSQTFKITQDIDRIEITDEEGSLFAIFEKEMNAKESKSLMYVKSATGEQVAVLKEQKPPKMVKDENGQAVGVTSTPGGGPVPPGTPVPPVKIGLRLYGHSPLYAGQVPKRKRTYNGPPPLYLWGSLEKKRSTKMALLGGGATTKYTLSIPFMPTDVVYTIKSSSRNNNKSNNNNHNNNNANSSRRKLLSIPFGGGGNSNNTSSSAAASAATGSTVGEERKVTCNGRVCAVLRRCQDNGIQQQEVTVHPDTDPLLMIMFFASSNQLFEETR